jgi:branched-chain amino acid aminotransferase
MIGWLNGRLVDQDQPHIKLTDHGFTIGDGVFETLITKGGAAFALTQHLSRLGRSAQGLGLLPPDPDVTRAAVAAVLKANTELVMAGPLRLRITYTSGPGPAGSERVKGEPTLGVTASVANPWPATTSIGLAPWPRNEQSPVTGLKTTSYAENAVALAWARARGHSEALLLNLVGRPCEGTGTNLFAVIDGGVVTPPIRSGCLAGITRHLVIQWCDVKEHDLTLKDLWAAQELFVTSSTRDIQPVHALDNMAYSAPGPLTQRCMYAFEQHARLDPDPA